MFLKLRLYKIDLKRLSKNILPIEVLSDGNYVFNIQSKSSNYGTEWEKWITDLQNCGLCIFLLVVVM